MISIDTNVICPGCNQAITISQGRDGWYTECGGEGDGACTVWFAAEPRCRAVHEDLYSVFDGMKAWCRSCAKNTSI